MKLTLGKRGEFFILALTILVVMAWSLSLYERSLAASRLEVGKKKRVAWSAAMILLDRCKAFQRDRASTRKVYFRWCNIRTQRAFLDPWGRQFQYAYPGLHNKLREPDVWSFGGNLNDPNGIIGTWNRNLSEQAGKRIRSPHQGFSRPWRRAFWFGLQKAAIMEMPNSARLYETVGWTERNSLRRHSQECVCDRHLQLPLAGMRSV